MGFEPDKESRFVPDESEQKPQLSLWERLTRPDLQQRKSLTSPRTFLSSETSQAVGKLQDKYNKFIDTAAYDIGGKVTDIAAGTVPPEAAAGLGFAANVATQYVPSWLTGKAFEGMLSPRMENWAQQLMTSALKPPKVAQETGKAARAVETLLEKGVSVTPGGVMKLRSEIDTLNREITQKIMQSKEVVDKQAALQHIGALVARTKAQVNPQSDLVAIQKAVDDFLTHPDIAKTMTMPVQTAQKMKSGTYTQIGEKYGELGSATIEAQKTLARGLKDEIAKKVPGIDKLNKAESDLLNAESLVSARVLMDMNKNPLSLAWLSTHPATWLAFAADRSPFIKSLLARGLHSGAQTIPNVAGQVAGVPVGQSMAERPE